MGPRLTDDRLQTCPPHFIAIATALIQWRPQRANVISPAYGILVVGYNIPGAGGESCPVDEKEGV